MNSDTIHQLKRALVESGATIAFIAALIYAPLLAVSLFLISYLTNKR